jgi:methylaspartate mutase epsilon subunit
MDLKQVVKNIKNEHWSEDFFFKVRQETLAQWPTGQDVNLEEAIAYHKSIPPHKNVAKVLAKAKAEGRTLVQPRGGVALVDPMIDLLRHIQDEGNADILPTTIDSYSRTQRYKECQRGIEESVKLGRSMLNGLPAVNHGVQECRRIVEAVDRPLCVRTGTSDARLLAEITLAAGYTDFLGGGIDYNIPYTKNIPLEVTLFAWQYVDRLVAYYEEHGITINREQYGALSGTLLPPSICAAISVLQGLLAMKQGVKRYAIGYAQCGHLLQDVAAIRALVEIGEEYFHKFGYKDIMVTSVLHQWMGAFPPDEAQAFGVIGYGAATAALAGATQVITKTTHEAIGIPTKEANAAGVRISKQIIQMLGKQRYPNTPELMAEISLIKQETRAIVDKVMEMGDGDVAVGIIRAFASGVLDIPFCPSMNNKNKAMPVRDNDGLVRWLDPGNLPIPKEIKDFHREKILERAKVEGRKPGYEMTIDDIYAVNRGKLIGRPLGCSIG